MNTSARFYLLYNSRNMLKTQQSCVFIQSILQKQRTFLTFILSNHDVITSMTSNYDYDVIDIMTFCNCNISQSQGSFACLLHVCYMIVIVRQYNMDYDLCYIIKPSYPLIITMMYETILLRDIMCLQKYLTNVIVGFATWICDRRGRWRHTPDTTQCVSKEYMVIARKVYATYSTYVL